MEEQKQSEKVNEEENKSLEEEKSKLKFYEFTEDLKTKLEQILENDKSKKNEFWQNKYESDAAKYWDIFYKENKTNFFKDRHYLTSEFPELLNCANEKKIFCELGCGVGNALFPLAKQFPLLYICGMDFSKRAIEMCKENELTENDKMQFEVCDLVKDEIPQNFPSPDYASLIFVLSAINPINFEKVAGKISQYMQSGSILFFRDYGKYDHAEIKFAQKKNQKLDENFYVKNNGTRCYYFTTEEIEKLFCQVGFKQIENKYHFRKIENKKLEMEFYRVWVYIIISLFILICGLQIQAKFIKI